MCREEDGYSETVVHVDFSDIWYEPYGSGEHNASLIKYILSSVLDKGSRKKVGGGKALVAGPLKEEHYHFCGFPKL